ncbi:1689_t:CDS:10 [Entrophospora sp. SA101]|nr:10633_t:CDS:10 [Entrophospora sp. SA101]CAJ0895312.1 1689_t:CDS:10 [Entrophospora sp. SA101]
MSALFTKRLSKELLDLKINPPAGIEVVDTETFKSWKLNIDGVDGTLYAEIILQMSEQSSESNNGTNDNSNNNRRPQYYCYSCRRVIEPLMAPYPTCPRCNREFVEEIEDDNDPREFAEHNLSGHDTDDELDDPFTPGNLQNGPFDAMQIIQNVISSFLQTGSGGPFRVQTESRDGSVQENQNQPRQNIIFAMGSAGDDRPSPQFPSLAQIFQRALDDIGNNPNLNAHNISGDPRDYAWGSSAWDNIITQLMELQSGRQAPPPATEEVIEALPKTKISKKQVEEQLSCPVCKDEFNIEEEAISLPCSHAFHEDCIKPWLKMNGTCPVCRLSLGNQEESNNDQNGQNRNNGSGSSSNNNSSSSSSMGFRFFNTNLPGSYPGNQQQNNQQNRQEDNDQYPDPMDIDPQD